MVPETEMVKSNTDGCTTNPSTAGVFEADLMDLLLSVFDPQLINTTIIAGSKTK
jgi:hypothetical protein